MSLYFPDRDETPALPAGLPRRLPRQAGVVAAVVLFALAALMAGAAVVAFRPQEAFEHDGLTHPVAGWRPSRGIRNIDLRAQDLKGSLVWRDAVPDRLCMELRFPLTHGATK